MADLNLDGGLEPQQGKGGGGAEDSAAPDGLPEGQTDPEAGDGPGGRAKVRVLTEGRVVTRAPRAGDQQRPRCPICSTEKIAVLCGARGSTGMVTNYYCPMDDCSYSVQRLRPVVAEQLREGAAKLAAQQRLRERPFVERD